MTTLPEFISPSTAAKLLDYKSRSSIHRLIARGEFPVIRIGKTVRIDKKAFQAWVKDRASDGASEA